MKRFEELETKNEGRFIKRTNITELEGGGGVKTRELRSLMSEGNQALRKMKRELGAVLAGKWAERKGNGRDEPLE